MKRLNARNAYLFFVLSGIFTSPTAFSQVCDADSDLDIDRDDINLITAARNTSAVGADDSRDADGDGFISVNDARQCVLQCTLSRCAIVNQNDVDNDQDGFTENQGDCNDANAAINPDAIDIPGNGIDENCDGQDAVDPLDIDDDLDGFTENQGDCDDVNSAINPNAIDIVGNGVDENCDGQDAADPLDIDDDLDGFTENQGDCNDVDASISPIVTDIPGNGIDENCDGVDDLSPNDIDNDGDGLTENQGDCDDGNASVFLGAFDIPGNGIDENCDGANAVNPNDVDNDVDGFTENLGDCDDTNASIHPNATDIPGNGIDENCDGVDSADPNNVDNDRDGYTENEGDCNDSDANLNPGAIDIPNNGIDENCDGTDAVDLNLIDNDQDGFTENQSDCNDADALINPNATDIPDNGIDENCDGADAVDPNTVDNDQDGFSEIAGDCDDTDASINPNAQDIPGNGIDENCDGADTPISIVLVPDIDSVPSIEFGPVDEGTTIETSLTVFNKGSATLFVTAIVTDVPEFEVSLLPGSNLPLSIDPGQSNNLQVSFIPPLGSVGTNINGAITIESNDPDESPYNVVLTGKSVAPALLLPNNPTVGAHTDDIISASNCFSVTGVVDFLSSSTSADSFTVQLTDQGGVSTSSPVFAASAGSGAVNIDSIDACGLADGIIEVSVIFNFEGTELPPFIGTPAVKNTSALQAPVLDPLPAITSDDVIEVCGSSRANTTVRIEGGAIPVLVVLDSGGGMSGGVAQFCVDITLRQNTENVLIASAIDDLAPEPKPIAYTQPVTVINLDPSEIVIAEASSRPLTEEETIDLVNRGVININDPENFNVSMFTIVLTIGAHPVTISQPVVVPKIAGVGYGGGSIGWSTSSGSGGSGSGGSGSGSGGSGGGGGSVVFGSAGCTSSCGQIFVFNPGNGGQAIPGVIIIDGRIKTLKEFFQITIALFNASDTFVLQDMQSVINLPAGLSPVRAGIGTDVSTINTDSAIDQVMIGEIGPNSTGTGQFIVRGDSIGTYDIDVNFSGLITAGGLTTPVPVSGSAGTSLRVLGPPKLAVVVRHPSDTNGPDVSLNEIYDLIVEITNLSSRPALYTSLDLFIGGGARLVDENNIPIPKSDSIRTIGTLASGETSRLAFRVESLLEGEIIACQGIASENITLSVDTGPDGSDCSINNLYPAAFEPAPVDAPPTILGINPLSGETGVPVTTSIVSVFTPESSCLVADSWANVIVAPIDGDQANGFVIVSADLDQIGTFYLEELNALGTPVAHIPTDLVLESPPAGGTTIAVLRLGLPAPLSQTFLKPNTQYRVTLVGGNGGVCSAASGAELPMTFRRTFTTSMDCSIPGDLVLKNIVPANGAIDIPLNQSITLNFSDRLKIDSVNYIPGDLFGSSFGVYQNPSEVAGELVSEGTAISGSGVLSNFNKTFTFTPSDNLAEDSTVYVRLTQGLLDVCGKPLKTATINGVLLNSFSTIVADVTAPTTPLVDPISTLTNAGVVHVSGSAEALSNVQVLGGAVIVSVVVPESGLFAVNVPLNLDSLNTLSVQSNDASGNISAVVDMDIDGGLLNIRQDSTPPTVISHSPVDGSIYVPINTAVLVVFNEAIDPGSALGFSLRQGSLVIPTTLSVSGNAVSLIPHTPLNFNSPYSYNLASSGIRDLAGNNLTTTLSATFSTELLINPPDPSTIAPLLNVTSATISILNSVATPVSGSAGYTLNNAIGRKFSIMNSIAPPIGGQNGFTLHDTISDTFSILNSAMPPIGGADGFTQKDVVSPLFSILNSVLPPIGGVDGYVLDEAIGPSFSTKNGP